MTLREMTRTDETEQEQEFDVKKSFLADLPEAKQYNESEINQDYEKNQRDQVAWQRNERKKREAVEYHYPMNSDF